MKIIKRYYIHDNSVKVTLGHLAKRWGISRSGAWNYINRGKLAKGKRVGRCYLYPIDTPRPAPLARNKRGRYSTPEDKTVVLETSWAIWPAPERAP